MSRRCFMPRAFLNPITTVKVDVNEKYGCKEDIQKSTPNPISIAKPSKGKGLADKVEHKLSKLTLKPPPIEKEKRRTNVIMNF